MQGEPLCDRVAHAPSKPGTRTASDRQCRAEDETSATVSIGDIDGNGTLDFILAKGRHWPLNNLTLRNDGRGHFAVSGTFGRPDWSTRYVTLADLNAGRRPAAP
jgi:hypothetical protein